MKTREKVGGHTWVAWSHICNSKRLVRITLLNLYGHIVPPKILYFFLRFDLQNHHHEQNLSLSLLTVKISSIERQRLQPLNGIMVSNGSQIKCSNSMINRLFLNNDKFL